MNRCLSGLGIAAWMLALAACAGVDPAPADTNEDDVANDRALSEMALVPQVKTLRACEASTTPGTMACLARIRLGNDGAIHPLATPPSGLGPADLQSAYLIDTNGGAGATVAIVDAQDSPNAEADLNVYRTTYGLPPCTTANGCFKKVNQTGAAAPLPAPDKGWATEIMLDLEMASATCPKCKILLVEATTA